MSEDDRDIDVESADDVPDIGMEATASCQSPSLTLGVSAATCVNINQSKWAQHAAWAQHTACAQCILYLARIDIYMLHVIYTCA